MGVKTKAMLTRTIRGWLELEAGRVGSLASHQAAQAEQYCDAETHD
jgi:hypothetical protein